MNFVSHLPAHHTITKKQKAHNYFQFQKIVETPSFPGQTKPLDGMSHFMQKSREVAKVENEKKSFAEKKKIKKSRKKQIVVAAPKISFPEPAVVVFR